MTFDEVSSHIAAVPFHQNFELTCLELGPSELKVALKWSGTLVNETGSRTLHGGAVATLMDMTASYLVFSQGAGGGATISLAIDFLRPATGDIRAEASMLKQGRTVTTVAISAFDETDRLVAAGRCICASQ